MMTEPFRDDDLICYILTHYDKSALINTYH